MICRCYLSTYNGAQVVVKMPKRDDHDVMNEIPSLAALPPHKNLLPLLGASFSPLCLVSPFCAGGSLEKVLHDWKAYKESEGKSTKPALGTLSWLHCQR